MDGFAVLQAYKEEEAENSVDTIPLASNFEGSL